MSTSLVSLLIFHFFFFFFFACLALIRIFRLDEDKTGCGSRHSMSIWVTVNVIDAWAARFLVTGGI